MANPNPNTTGLSKPKWNNTPTVAIRIPEKYQVELMQIARQLDSDEHVALPNDYETLNREIKRLEAEVKILKDEKEKLQKQLESKNPPPISVQPNRLQEWYLETLPKLKAETGYKSNSASKLIKSIEELASSLND